MSLLSVQRTASWALVLLATGCSFDPTLSGPLAGEDAGPSDMRVGPSDADDVEDAGDPTDDMSSGDLMTMSDTGDRVDMSDQGPVDQGTGDQGRDANPPVDTGRDMSIGPAMCDGMLVDLRTDPNHCGECDNPCDPDHGQCVGGTCECELGGTACGDANLCTPTDFDPNNCGQCGRICAVGEVCIDGDCFCRQGLMRCNGECIDPDNDPRHCGTCGNDCGGKVCLDGNCENRNNCPFGTWDCDTPDGAACVRGRETDLHCSPTITDACGTACQGDQFCYDAGILAGPRCFNYRPGLGCTDCPCADCTDGEFCVATDDIPGVAFCVSE